MREDIETVARVREAVGDRMEIMVDGNQAQSSGNWQPGVRWDYRHGFDPGIGSIRVCGPENRR